MPYLLGQQNDYWRRYNQRRALTGLPASYQEQRGALDSMLGTAAERDIQEAQLRNQYNIQNRQLNIAEQAQKDAARAASISGVASLGQLGLEGYLGYKYLTKPPSPMEQYAASMLKGQVPGAAAPAVAAGAGSGGAGLLTGVGSGATTPLVGSAPELAATTGMGAWTEPAAEAGGGLLGAAAPAVLPAAVASIGGHILGKPVSKLLGTHEKTTSDVMGVLGGAGAGFAVGGPIGAVVGGIVGGISDMSVICSELLRQKRITERERTKCIVYRFRHIPGDMFMAYLEWAAPIVAVMKRGGVGNALLLPFAKAFVGYMVAVQDHRKPSLLERMVWKHAWNRCRKIAQRNEQYVQEVSCGLPS